VDLRKDSYYWKLRNRSENVTKEIVTTGKLGSYAEDL
jgi:hypothetical protein